MSDLLVNREHTLHLTTQLAQMLRRDINAGMYGNGAPIPSERELMEQHGVSRTTVRRAIQQLVEEAVLTRIPGSGTYVNAPAPQPVVGQDTLGLLVPTLANPYYAELSRAIEREAAAGGLNLVVGQSDYRAEQEANYLERFAENRALRGVLAVPSGDRSAAAAYQRLLDRNIPLVCAVRGIEGVEVDEIATDHVGGASMIVNHLIALGHRRIAYIGTSRGLPHRHLQGYRQALSAAGIPEDPSLTILVDGDDEHAGVEGVARLLQQNSDFSAIFARVDITAIGVLRALRTAGLRVLEDVSVVGFDNTQLAAHCNPPLTTVEHMRGEIGRLAVLFLRDRIEGRYRETARRVIITPRLVIRESTHERF
jgi:DNA-binding LacI/PurR family transcriptional regulator